MAVQIDKEPLDEIDLDALKNRKEKDIFDILDRIPPGLINGFFIFVVIYLLYHLTLFCVRANGVGY